MKIIPYYFLLLTLFLIWPFGGFIASLVLLYRKNLSEGQQNACLIVTSLFWGILAFTQKSLASIDTDCIRYYNGFDYFEILHPLDIWGMLDFGALLNFVFYPISAFTVALTSNVQSISFLWTFLVYILTFLSARRLMKHYKCYTNRKYANIILSLSFCFIAFVQVSELLKQSSSFAVFFYGFTLFLTRGSKVAVILLIIAAIGLHPSSIMLLPLFFYNKVTTLFLIIMTFVIILISQFVDIIGFFMNLLPGGNYTQMIIERFGGDVIDGGTLHYIILQLLMLCPVIFIWLTGRAKEKDMTDIVNVVILYFLIASINFSNLVAYLRFAIFSHWLFILVSILCVKNYRFKDVRLMLNLVIICMFLMTARWTIGRTTPGGYASSYMDNNLANIVFSTSYDYLKVDYNKN